MTPKQPSRATLLASIASTISDYRSGEIPAPTPAHVDRWIKQFPATAQELLLTELDHVLKKTYIPRSEVTKFLKLVLRARKLVGSDPCSFWKKANVLNIQQRGHSRRDMLAMFEPLLEQLCGLKLSACGSRAGDFVYLDDAVFTGSTVRNELLPWIETDAPKTGKLHIVVAALHNGGQYYAHNCIAKACNDAGKSIDVTWWRRREIEDRKAYIDESDVLRPTTLPSGPSIQAYVSELKYSPILRTGTSLGKAGFFATPAGREALEQQMLRAGVKIRTLCPHLNKYQRPLGNMVLETLGFGALVVTYRNCPNNCPLAFWAGNPWYPLFPRKTN